MSDPGTMRRSERIGDLDATGQCLVNLQSVLTEPMGQRLALDELH